MQKAVSSRECEVNNVQTYWKKSKIVFQQQLEVVSSTGHGIFKGTNAIPSRHALMLLTFRRTSFSLSILFWDSIAYDYNVLEVGNFFEYFDNNATLSEQHFEPYVLGLQIDEVAQLRASKGVNK